MSIWRRATARRSRLCLFSTSVLSTAAGPSFSQESTEIPTLEPLVVTALEQDPETTSRSPSTVETISAETVRARDIDTARKAFQLIPNVAVTDGDSPRASSFSVRGSHEITFHEFSGGRSGVGFYLDGIPVLDAYGRDLTLFNVEQLSLSKGPHGTSVGVPNSMGLIEVVTRSPDEETRRELSYTYGSYELHQVLGHVSGPLRDDLFLSLDGRFSQDEGWFEDRMTGDAYGKHETLSGRARLRWLPSERWEFNLTLGADDHDDDPQVYVRTDLNQDPYKAYTSPEAYATGGQSYQALQALWRGDTYQIKSTTSHRDSEFDDHDPLFLKGIFDPASLPRTREHEASTWTQEIRVESTDPDAQWRWRTGLFFSDRDSTLDHYMLGLGPWEGDIQMNYRQNDYAIYGEATRVVGTQLEVSAGLRLQTFHDNTRSHFVPTPFAESLGATPLSLDRHEDFGAALPMAAASWQWCETQRSFLRFSTGVQPGGLEVTAAATADYDSERSTHYELGHQSSFRDETVTLNATAFYTDYRDYQSYQFNPGGQTILNADHAHALGLEAQLRVRPTTGLELYFGAGYTKARFDDFDSPIGDFSGNTINNIPEGTQIWR